jgi:polyisoprenoid-binding protein YceI
MTLGKTRKRLTRGAMLAVLSGCVLLSTLSAAVAAENAETSPAPPGTLNFVGKNLLMKAKGTFHEWRVVESSVDMDAIEDAFVVVEVSLASVDTGIERRDEHLRTPDFFEIETYPVAIVRIHSPRPIADEVDELARFTVQFDVDLHGVTKTLEGEIVLTGRDPLVFEGDLTIDRTEFGVGPKPNRWNPTSPRAEIPVHFNVEL